MGHPLFLDYEVMLMDIRNDGDPIFSQVLKIDFFNVGRILRFSPSSFKGLGCGTSQMIEKFFLYKIV